MLASSLRTPAYVVTLLYLVINVQAVCFPGQPCFPSLKELAALNASVDGLLFAQRPVGAVCYVEDPLYSAASCSSELPNATSDQWIADTPSAYAFPPLLM